MTSHCWWHHIGQQGKSKRPLAGLHFERFGGDTLEKRLPLTAVPSSARAVVAAVSLPAAPQAPAATAGIGGISLRWAAPSANGGGGILDYRLDYQYRRNASSSFGSIATYDDGVSSQPSAYITGLPAGQYVFRISARNAAGWSRPSPWSNIVDATSAPSEPLGVSAIAGDGRVQLTWSPPAIGGGTPITDYTIQTSIDRQVWATFNDGVSMATTATVTPLTNGVPYFFRVVAINAAGTSNYSGMTTATPISSLTVPLAPNAVLATAGNSQVSLSWQVPADGGSPITGYVIEGRIDEPGRPWRTMATPPASSTQAVITSVSNGIPYVFRVAAINAVGTGAFRQTFNAVTPTAATTANERWTNSSSTYAVAIWTGIAASGRGQGPAIVLRPGQSAFPIAFQPGTQRTLYIAYARSANLITNWHTMVNPTHRVRTQSSQQVNIAVSGFNSITVNNLPATAMY